MISTMYFTHILMHEPGSKMCFDTALFVQCLLLPLYVFSLFLQERAPLELGLANLLDMHFVGPLARSEKIALRPEREVHTSANRRVRSPAAMLAKGVS